MHDVRTGRSNVDRHRQQDRSLPRVAMPLRNLCSSSTPPLAPAIWSFAISAPKLFLACDIGGTSKAKSSLSSPGGAAAGVVAGLVRGFFASVVGVAAAPELLFLDAITQSAPS